MGTGDVCIRQLYVSWVGGGEGSHVGRQQLMYECGGTNNRFLTASLLLTFHLQAMGALLNCQLSGEYSCHGCKAAACAKQLSWCVVDCTMEKQKAVMAENCQLGSRVTGNCTA